MSETNKEELLMKKWTMEGRIVFRAHDYICDAEDPDEALEKLLKDDFFDKTVSTYTFDKVESEEV